MPQLELRSTRFVLQDAQVRSAAAQLRRSIGRQKAVTCCYKVVLLPPLSEVRELSQSIAFAVARQAQADGVALKSSDDTIKERVERHFWYPRYRRYRRAAF